MPDYPNLAALRQALTTDDADERGRAYGAVLNADDDVQPSDVLAGDPDEETVDSLADADVIPDDRGAGGRGGRPAAERDEEVVDLLRDIRDLLDDDVVAQDGGAP